MLSAFSQSKLFNTAALSRKTILELNLGNSLCGEKHRVSANVPANSGNVARNNWSVYRTVEYLGAAMPSHLCCFLNGL